MNGNLVYLVCCDSFRKGHKFKMFMIKNYFFCFEKAKFSCDKQIWIFNKNFGKFYMVCLKVGF